jgi:type II secretory pathway pseudopilin PulG
MFRVSKFREQRRARERGYIMIVLLLSVALLSITFLGWIQKVDFEIKREREEEMIHRGVQYSRAVSKFVKKFRRYPTSVQELESTNNIRFLRKRYKDPITGKDFKVLHMNDMPSFPNTGGAGTPVADLVSQQQAANAASGKVASRISGPATDNAEGEASEPNRQTSGSDPSPDSQGDVSQDASQTDENSSNAPDKPDPNQPLALSPNATGWVIGVASTSKQKSMRVFNKQDHYNQWKFIYDPSTAHAGILTTPSQPPLSVALQPNQQQNEQAAPQAFGADSGQVNTPPGSARGRQ